MKAKGLMVPVQDIIGPEGTLEEAVVLLRKDGRGGVCVGNKGLPVVDAAGKLVGILSMRDILKAAFPFYMRMMDLGDFSWDGMVEEIAVKSGKKRVGDIMSSVVVTVHEDAPLMECIDHMIKNNVKRLPVLSDDGTVVGMLYEHDLFFAVTEALANNNQGVR